MKYLMKEKTDRPLFEYLVKNSMEFDYYLFDNFDEALKKAISESINGNRHFLIYEVHFNTKNREFYGQNTFDVFGGKVKYDKFAQIDLHLEFYINAGNWLNPRNDWVEILEKKFK